MIKTDKVRPDCPKCGHGHVLKSGTARGKKRFQCRECGYLFTLPGPRREGWKLKALSLGLYANGVSANNVARLLHLPEEKTQYWICEFCQNGFVKGHDYEVVKINLDYLRSLLPETLGNGDKNTVVALVDDDSGGIAGMFRLGAREAGRPVQGSATRPQELIEVKGNITGQTFIIRKK